MLYNEGMGQRHPILPLTMIHHAESTQSKEGKAKEELHLTINACQESKPADAIKKAANQLIGLIEANGGTVHSEK